MTNAPKIHRCSKNQVASALRWIFSASILSLGHPQAFLDRSADAFLTAIQRLHIEDAQQMVAPLRRRHSIPALFGTRLTLEGSPKNRGSYLFALHGQHQTLGHLLSAHDARFGPLGLTDEVRDSLAHGRAERLKPSSQLPFSLEHRRELRRYVDDRLLRQIGLQPDPHLRAGIGLGAGPHLPVHKKRKPILVPNRKQRGAECEAVDFSQYAPAAPLRPRLFQIDRHTSNHKPGSLPDRLEHGTKNLWSIQAHGVSQTSEKSHLEQDSRSRQSKLSFMDVLYGVHPVAEALKAGRRRFDHVLVASERHDERLARLIADCRLAGVRVRQESREQLTRLAGTPTHQGVVAVVRPQELLAIEDLFMQVASADGRSKARLVLALDGVEDPQNLGALLRVADGAGVDGIVLTERRSAPLSPTAVKASAGATEHLRIARVVNLVRALEELKSQNLWVIGLDERGSTDYDEIDLTGDCVLVLGREGAGLHDLVRRTCDHLLRIPMAGGVSSLNVSAAGAVVLYEAARQRRAVARKAKARPEAVPASKKKQKGLGS